MASILECSYIRRRLQEMEEIYPEPSILDQCDCTFYFYIGLSVVWLSLGSYISVLALGYIDGYLFSNLGHMWLVGPILVCCGLMMGVRSILYLRRKTLIKMIIRRRDILRGFQQLRQQSDQIQGENRNNSTETLPPAYEALMDCQAYSNNKILDVAPPTYEEAVFLHNGKIMVISENCAKQPSTSIGNYEKKEEEGESQVSQQPH